MIRRKKERLSRLSSFSRFVGILWANRELRSTDLDFDGIEYECQTRKYAKTEAAERIFKSNRH